MSTAVLQLRADERWTIASPITRASTTMAAIVVASLAAHLLLVAMAVVTTRTPPQPPTNEITVEIVQAPPPETKPAPAKAPEASQPAAPKAAEPAKLAAHPAEPTKPVPPEPARPVVPKPVPSKPTPPAKTAHAAPKAPPPPPNPAPQPAKPPAQPQMDAAERKLADLRHELENLRAEQAALQAERAAERAQPSAALRDSGLGPLPDSFQAVALPAAADGAGDAMSYQEIVFSALAKAKEIGRTKGLPGSAGVRFSIDDKGRLVEVDLVHKSGIAALDAEALAIVRRAAPFPAPPQGAQRIFSANVTFVADSAP